MPIHQRVILITGSSSGFGMLTAAFLASKGHIVYASMRDISKKEDLLKEYQKYPKEKTSSLRIIPIDVTSEKTIQDALEIIVKEEGRVDVLINNAGFGIGGFFEDISCEQFKAQFDVNFFGALNVTRGVLPYMRTNKKGLIINVSSMCAYTGTPAFSAYVSSKWALEGFSECLLMELMPFNIDVVVLQPGAYKTKIFFENARFAKDFDSVNSPYYQRNQFFRRFINQHMSNNQKDPIEVARTIEKIINKNRRHFRYMIGFHSFCRALFSRMIPTKCYANIINFFFSTWERK